VQSSHKIAKPSFRALFCLLALKFQLVEPEIVVRLVDFQLVGLARFINREADEAFREIIGDRRTPFD
jgi:hypothetical protein